MTKRKNFLFIEKENDTYTISMTPELQDDIGTVGYAEFEDVKELDANQAFLSLEAAKTVLEAQSPLKGTVVEYNEAAEDNPELLNSDKTEENWLIKLTDVDEEEYEALEEA